MNIGIGRTWDLVMNNMINGWNIESTRSDVCREKNRTSCPFEPEMYGEKKDLTDKS
jgi:hypothetical protein